MLLKAARPNTARDGAGLGNAQSLPACISEFIAPTAKIQEKYLASRFGLAAERARLVADLHFGGDRGC
jgi:hypothetical protein